VSYLCYLCLFGSSLPPVVCRRADDLVMLFVFVWFVFTYKQQEVKTNQTNTNNVNKTSALLQTRLVRLYLLLFVGGLMSYLRYLCLFGSSLPPVVCRRVHVLFTLFVFVWFVFTSSCL
jgi:protein-S-isoprenylcysteine O-methyltransferase Ste14